LKDIINPGFVPTPEKYLLVMEKNLFFYRVLLKKLVRSSAKVHIHMYTGTETSDGQKVFAA
jgi:ribosomal protein S17